MEYESLIITHLHRMWDEQISNGYITYDEMHDSLLDQVTGSMDISADELDEPIARLLGWDMEDITESQWRIWRNLVNEAANEFLMK